MCTYQFHIVNWKLNQKVSREVIPNILLTIYVSQKFFFPFVLIALYFLHPYQCCLGVCCLKSSISDDGKFVSVMKPIYIDSLYLVQVAGDKCWKVKKKKERRPNEGE